MPHNTAVESRHSMPDIYVDYSPMKGPFSGDKEIKLMKSQLQDTPLGVTLTKRSLPAAFPQAIAINGNPLSQQPPGLNYSLGLLPGQQAMPLQTTVSPILASGPPSLIANGTPPILTNGASSIITNGTQPILANNGPPIITNGAAPNAILNPAIATITGIPGGILTHCGYQFPQSLSYQIAALQPQATKVQQATVQQQSAQALQQLQAAQERSQALAYAQAVAQAEANAKIRARAEAEAEVQAQLRARVEEAHARAQSEAQPRIAHGRGHANRRNRAIEVQTQTESPKPFQQYIQQAAVFSQQKPTISRDFMNPYEIYGQKAQQTSPTFPACSSSFSPTQHMQKIATTSAPLAPNQLYQSAANDILKFQYQQQMQTLQNLQALQSPGTTSPKRKYPTPSNPVLASCCGQLSLPLQPATRTTSIYTIPSPPSDLACITSINNLGQAILQPSAYDKIAPHGNILYHQFLQGVLQLEQKMKDEANQAEKLVEPTQQTTSFPLRPPVAKRRKPISPMRYDPKNSNEI